MAIVMVPIIMQIAAMMAVTAVHVTVQMAAIHVIHTAVTVMIVQILDQAVLMTRVTAHYLVQSRVLMKTV